VRPLGAELRRPKSNPPRVHRCSRDDDRTYDYSNIRRCVLPTAVSTPLIGGVVYMVPLSPSITSRMTTVVTAGV